MNFIINPENGKTVSIYSREGKRVLGNYLWTLKQKGGSRKYKKCRSCGRRYRRRKQRGGMLWGFGAAAAGTAATAAALRRERNRDVGLPHVDLGGEGRTGDELRAYRQGQMAAVTGEDPVPPEDENLYDSWLAGFTAASENLTDEYFAATIPGITTTGLEQIDAQIRRGEARAERTHRRGGGGGGGGGGSGGGGSGSRGRTAKKKSLKLYMTKEELREVSKLQSMIARIETQMGALDHRSARRKRMGNRIKKINRQIKVFLRAANMKRSAAAFRGKVDERRAAVEEMEEMDEEY